MTVFAAIERDRFVADFDRAPFVLEHTLAGNDLFELERLVELAATMPADRIEYNSGALELDQDPDSTPGNGLTVAETIERIESNRSWMVIKNVEHDPTYAALLQDCLDEIGPYVAADRLLRPEGFVFVSSPGSVTPYHHDPEHNFLLQIRGTKRVAVFDPRDPVAVAEHQHEAMVRGAHRNLPYRPELADRAITVDLGPGEAVHIPIGAPHHVEVGGALSISFSVTFQTTDSLDRRSLHQLNHHLRRLRVRPTPVGVDPARDRAKLRLVRAGRRIKRLVGDR